jgi:hypothetical protein
MLDTKIAAMTNSVRLHASILNDALVELEEELCLTARQERSIVQARRRMSLLYRVMSSIERDLFQENQE